MTCVAARTLESAFAEGYGPSFIVVAWPASASARDANVTDGLSNDPGLQEHAADVLLEALQRALLGRTAGFDPETLTPAVAELVRFLAGRPQDAPRRVALAELLSVDSAGEIGLPLIAFATLNLFAGGNRLTTEAAQSVPREIDSRTLVRTYKAALQWAQDNHPVELGSSVLPAELLEIPADEFVLHLRHMADIAGEGREGEADLKWLEQIAVVAALAAPHSQARRNEDLEILRFAAGRFALAGRNQKARDFAEQALLLAAGDPLRARLAWYTFADTYHRVNNLQEAFLGMACALACDTAISRGQAWYEINGLIRMLRDLGMLDHALALVPQARSLLEEMGQSDGREHRLETLALGIRMLAWKGKDPDRDEAQKLLEAVVANVAIVTQARDELPPVTILLAQTIELCETLGVPIPDSHRARLEEALGQLAPAVADWIRATSRRAPSPEDVLKLAHGLQSARYSEDTGYDVRALVLSAERLLSSPVAITRPEIAAFAIEMMTDHGLAQPPEPGPAAGSKHDWLASGLDTAAKTAEQLSRSDIDVVLLGLDTNGHLVRVRFRQGQADKAVREGAATFSKLRFGQWSDRYPYAYGTDTAIANLFHTSLDRVGTTLELPTRSLLVMATPLQVLPPNILLTNGELVGRTTAMASAPSLAWVASRRCLDRAASGRRSGWIPLAEGGSGSSNGTLDMVAERLRACLSAHGIALHAGPQMPKNTEGSDLVVIAAHGQVGPDGSYFQSLADDTGGRISPDMMARTLARTGLVILFVCSGGRTDKHPRASTTVGLPRVILDRQCSAVVASPWPLDARVPSHWLPAFLEAWDAGVPLIDANFQANRAVERAMGDAPERCLAMNVYGDPLATAASSSERAHGAA